MQPQILLNENILIRLSIFVLINITFGFLFWLTLDAELASSVAESLLLLETCVIVVVYSIETQLIRRASLDQLAETREALTVSKDSMELERSIRKESQAPFLLCNNGRLTAFDSFYLDFKNYGQLELDIHIQVDHPEVSVSEERVTILKQDDGMRLTFTGHFEANLDSLGIQLNCKDRMGNPYSWQLRWNRHQEEVIMLSDTGDSLCSVGVPNMPFRMFSV